jgi:hypothetical protein
MTIKECIDIVDNLKPNQYSIESKVDWLSYIDHSIINEVLLTHEGYDGRYDNFAGYSPDALEMVLIVPSPYDRLYPAYLKMKIDEENGETARYNNSVTMFNAYLMEYKKWYNSNHMPISPSERRTIPQSKPSSMDVSDVQLEQLRKLLYADLHDDMLKEVSDDKLYAIVKIFMDTNAQMLKGKDGRDGVNGKDGRNGKDGMNGANGIGIQKAWIENGELKITLTSGVTQNLGVVKGEKGDKGERVTDEQIASAIGNYFKEHGQAKISSVELLSGSWVGSGNLYSQVVNISGVTENSQVDLTPSIEQLAIFYEKDIAFVTENDGGVVTVYVIGQKPQNDYTVQVTITEVAYV